MPHPLMPVAIVGPGGSIRAADPPELADETTIQNRLATCAACEHFAAPASCRLCGCAATGKIRLLSESCPAGKWGPPHLANSANSL